MTIAYSNQKVIHSADTLIEQHKVWPTVRVA